MSESMRSFLASEAASAGFEAFGITNAKLDAATGERLKQFVAQGHHASMAWMEETLERRLSPNAMWQNAKSALVFGMNYGLKRRSSVSSIHAIEA